MRKNDKPDDAYARLLDAFRWMERHADGVVREGEKLKRWAWRAARQYLWLMENAHEWMLRMIRSEYPDDGEPVDRWLRGHFAPVELLGDRVDDVIDAVRGGMSERQFVAELAGLWLIKQKSRTASKRRKAVEVLAERTIVPPPAGEESTEAQLATWKLRAEQQNAVVRRQAAELRSLRQRMGRLEKELRRLRLIVKRVDELDVAG